MVTGNSSKQTSAKPHLLNLRVSLIKIPYKPPPLGTQNWKLGFGKEAQIKISGPSFDMCNFEPRIHQPPTNSRGYREEALVAEFACKHGAKQTVVLLKCTNTCLCHISLHTIFCARDPVLQGFLHQQWLVVRSAVQKLNGVFLVGLDLCSTHRLHSFTNVQHLA